MRFALLIALSFGSFVFADEPATVKPAAPVYMPGEVNRNQQVYDWAKREATLMARYGRVKHYLGCGPGIRYSGVGSSFSGRPNHCYLNMPQSRIIARACVRGRNGMWYWSCHLR
jgi:hypothetical protein